MYGFHERAESDVLCGGIDRLCALLSLCSPEELPEGLARKAEELKDDEAGLFAFAAGLREIGGSLLHTGQDWAQRPFDLLAHPRCPGEDRREIFLRCRNWELLTMALSFGEACGRERADPEALLERLVADLRRFEKRTLPARMSLDVFDRQISYHERMARWQGDALPAEERISIPFEGYALLLGPGAPARGRGAGRIELTLFCAMVCRHLKRRGITAGKLKERDYWHLPGGQTGLGIYQKRYTPETFFQHIRRALPGTGIRLISVNEVPMISLPAGLFRAFEGAGNGAGPGDLPEDFRQALKEKVPAVTVDRRGTLSTADDGTDAPFEALYRALELYREMGAGRSRARPGAAKGPAKTGPDTPPPPPGEAVRRTLSLLLSDDNSGLTREELRALFDAAAAFYPRGAAGERNRLELSDPFGTDGGDRWSNDLKKAFLMILLWKFHSYGKEKPAFRLSFGEDGLWAERFTKAGYETPEQVRPFEGEEEFVDFMCFLGKLREGRVHRTVHLRRAGGLPRYELTFHNSYPPLSGEEAALLAAVESAGPGRDLAELNRGLEAISRCLDSALPEQISSKKLLEPQEKPMERRGSLLCHFLLYRAGWTCGCAGCPPLDTRGIFPFRDEEDLMAFRTFRAGLGALKKHPAKKYDLTLEDAGGGYRVSITGAVKQRP